MAKRGQKATKTDELNEHDRQNLRTLLRKAGGNLKTLESWAKEELRSVLIELRDEEILPQLMFMEEGTWKYTRLPEAGRINKQLDREMGVKTRLHTRRDDQQNGQRALSMAAPPREGSCRAAINSEIAAAAGMPKGPR